MVHEPIPTDGLTPADHEALAAYLDGELSAAERAGIDARLRAEPALARALDAQAATRALIAALPLVQAPRDFRLTPEMVAPPAPVVAMPAPATRRSPRFSLAPWMGAAAATVLVAVGLFALVDRPASTPPLTFDAAAIGTMDRAAPAVAQVEDAADEEAATRPDDGLMGAPPLPGAAESVTVPGSSMDGGGGAAAADALGNTAPSGGANGEIGAPELESAVDQAPAESLRSQAATASPAPLGAVAPPMTATATVPAPSSEYEVVQSEEDFRAEAPAEADAFGDAAVPQAVVPESNDGATGPLAWLLALIVRLLGLLAAGI
jgi:hypothetical protein